MSKGPHGGVSFNAFESWWKERMGILDSDIPVLPEYMVQKIVESGRGRRACTSGVGHRKGGELWDILRPVSLGGPPPTHPSPARLCGSTRSFRLLAWLSAPLARCPP